MTNTYTPIKKSFHQILQEKILTICNFGILIGLIFLGITTFLAKQYSITIITIIGGTFIIISLIFLFFRQYTIACYVLICALSFASYRSLTNRTDITPDLLYLYSSYQAIAIILAGLIAPSRILPIFTGTLSILYLSFYLLNVQAPVIGLTHIVQISGAYCCIILSSLAADQTYKLTGNIMQRFHEQQQQAALQLKQIRDIISIYQYNQENGNKLQKQTINSDDLAAQLQEILQKFIEDIHSLDQILKETSIRTEDTINSTSGIVSNFKRHQDSMHSYKNKVEQLSETSIDIENIVQNRKFQMTELITLSQQGGNHMQNSIVAIEKVAENSKNILDMISLIMEVAERTNILALNAAVEASRAGKSGGGFAIVAKEIKALSTETTQSAEIVNRTLQVNIKSISEAVDIIKNVGRSFTTLNTSIVEFSTAIDDISVRIKNLNNQNNQITIDTQKNLSLVEEIQNILEKTLNSIVKEKSTIKELQKMSEILTQGVTNVHQKTNIISDSGRKTQECYRAYTYSVKQVDDIINELSQQLIK